MGQQSFVLSPATLRQVDQSRYLTAPNYARYRALMRYFYAEHLKLRDWLAPAEVFEAVRRHLDDDYTLEECERDLHVLEGWGNLQADENRTKARSLVEWYRPRFVYHITQLSVGFEELLATHENPTASGGTLNATLLEQIWVEFDRLHQTLRAPLPDPVTPEFLREYISGPWGSLLRSVNELRESAANYHHTLSAALPTDLAQVDAFLVYKDTLLAHLRGFVDELQRMGPRLRGLVRRWMEDGSEELLVTLLTESDLRNAVSRLSTTGTPLSLEQIRDAVHRPALRGVGDWFALGGGAEFLLQATANAILQIVRQSARIATRHEAGLSRRRDLEHLARAFAALELNAAPDVEAHRLAARALGAALPRHLRGGSGSDTMMSDKDPSVWVQRPAVFALRRPRRGRPFRERTSPIGDTRAMQAAMEAEEERRLAEERQLWDRFFGAGEVTLASLTIADPVLRRRVLEVLRRALINPNRTAAAADGRLVRVTAPTDEWCYGEVVGPDGTLVLPAMTLTIEQRDPAPAGSSARRRRVSLDAIGGTPVGAPGGAPAETESAPVADDVATKVMA